MTMTSKAEYLKKYMSAEGGGDGGKKKKKKVKKHANLAILDDDVDWRTLAPKGDYSDLEDPDEAPTVAEFHDEAAARKWQPLKSIKGEEELEKPPPSPDLSPPRRRPLNEDLSPPRQAGKYDSPPRRGQRAGVARKRRHDSPDISPHRKRGHDSKRHWSPDLSHRGMHTLPDDASPPRRRGKRHDSPDLSPTGKRPSPDISPPRRRYSPDATPPPRGHKQHYSPDLSPPRKHSSSDLSPPRAHRKKHSPDLSPPRRKGGNAASGREVKLASGAKAGLQTADVLRKENALARDRQEKLYKELAPEFSGRNAETVYRDKEGKRIDPKLERLKKRQEEREKTERDAQFMEWGRGVVQTRAAHEKIADELYEMSKPLARYQDDEDLEKMLKEREREGDPMLAFIKKKKAPKTTSGKPKKERATYKGEFPPNRFGIRPGYRWDGVNRSNGYEKAWFARESNKKAMADEAYKWSVEDM